MISNCSRFFTKALFVNTKPNLLTYPAFSLSRNLSIHLHQVLAMASESASSSPFKKIQIQRDDTAFDAYVIGKEDDLGIVVLQDWWGVDFEIKKHAIEAHSNCTCISFKN
ncbi:unnamed protein product [Fraxinus pennsylvanica]|uniref:Dienelactone hydrolase domain-containing protein n=1 Tax=Fraxinus pennsylvanica TaxID=56036 RepID=A0AAD1ZVV5_9LAMI|nr:unnamed protein product [Fraxinus pennsylvanica]